MSSTPLQWREKGVLMTPADLDIRWQHMTEANHEADPHYNASGKWVCWACREPLREVDAPMTTKQGARTPQRAKETA